MKLKITYVRRLRCGLAAGISATLALTACNSDTAPRTTSSIGDVVNDGVVAVQPSAADLAQPPSAPNAQMQAVLNQVMASHSLDPSTLSPVAARNQPTPRDAVIATLAAQGRQAVVEPVGTVVQRTISGAEGPLLARIYTPAGAGPFPVLVYFHGGGWVLYDIDTYDASCRALTNAANAIVISVAYRKAPEHKFPAAANDAFASYRWALDSAGAINGNPNKVAVGGESVGGNLAAVVSLMARDQKIKIPVYQLLIYPVVDFNVDTQSYHDNANAPFFTRAAGQWAFDKYLRTPADGANPYVSPLRASLSGLPPATIITSQLGVLRSEGKAYADKLAAAGVPVVYQNYDGVTHEFFSMQAVLDQAHAALLLAADGLKKSFAAP
ncbi:MAG: alpha/beta hydrolase fold domain-containing protein [Gemmatimonadaceae bacterium]